MKAKSIKSTKPSTSSLHPFRVVLRGTKMNGKTEVRVRHVFTTKARDEGEAATIAAKAVETTIREEGLKDVYLNVFAPLVKAA